MDRKEDTLKTLLNLTTTVLLLLSPLPAQNWFTFSPPNETYSPQGYSAPSFYFHHSISHINPQGLPTPNKSWVRAWITYRDRYLPNFGHVGGGGGELFAWVDADTSTNYITISTPTMVTSDTLLDTQLLDNGQQLAPVTPTPQPVYSYFPWFPNPILTANIIHRHQLAGGSAFAVELRHWLHVSVCFGVIEVPPETIEAGFDLHIIGNLHTVVDGSGWVYRRIEVGDWRK